MMDVLNTVNDVLEPNVEAPTPAEETGVAIEQPQGVADPAPPQSPEVNSVHAKIRREAERAAKETAQSELVKSIASFGFINTHRENKVVTTLADLEEMHSDFAIANDANQRGVSFEQQQELVEGIKRQVKETDPEIIGLRQQLDEVKAQEAKLHMDADFDKILKHNPKETARSITELGDDFLVLMAAQERRGETPDPIRAYEMIRAATTLKAPPPSMGDIKSGGDTTSEFYTFDQVAAMSKGEVEKNYDKIQRSQTRW